MFLNYQKIRIESIPIKDCRHFRGHRYGLFSNHIYEDYVYGLSKNTPIETLRLQFIKRLLGMRSDDFGKTLGIALINKYSNWDYPWNMYKTKLDFLPSNNPDIVCHTSLSHKILMSHINREFKWLEKVYDSIKNQGYLPEKYEYITVLKLASHQKNSFIVLDGNHRLSALSVLGETHVKMKVLSKMFLKEALSFLWFGLLFRNYTLADSKAVFSRYFLEINPDISEADDFASIIIDEPPLVKLL